NEAGSRRCAFRYFDTPTFPATLPGMYAKSVLLCVLLAVTARGADETLRCLPAPTKVPEHWSGVRHYARDREVAVSHVILDITPDFKQRTISGTSVITFKPIAKSLDELKLDAVDLSIDAVES